METVTRNPAKKNNARKMAAKGKPKTKEVPMVDVPNSSQKQINEFVKLNEDKVATYMTQNFDEIGADEIALISREVAECVILKRSPKKGGVWGDDLSIIEDVIKHVSGPKIAVVNPDDEVVGIDAAPEDEDGEQEESEAADSEGEEEVAQPEEPTPSTLASEPSSPAKQSKTKSKAKPVKTSPQKTATPAKAKAPEKKKPTKAKAAPKTSEKKESKPRTPAVSVDAIKKLKGKEQWFTAARYLKGQKKLWIQAQDIPEVIGHVYDVSQGKAKLNEEGFDGKGEKVYRRNRVLGFKETIESFLKGLK